MPNREEVPFINLDVDTSQYPGAVRQIHHFFEGADAALEVLVINFAKFPIIAIPMFRGYYTGRTLSYRRIKQAVETLLERGLISLHFRHWNDTRGNRGKCSTYRQTPEFKKKFKFRLQAKLAVIQSSLCPSNNQGDINISYYMHYRNSLNSITALEAYFLLISAKNLSLSNGGQVCSKILLERKEGKRLYAKGIYNYQGLPKEERKLLLLDGEPTVELDYKSMHGNLLLNRENVPSDSLFYERILRCLRKRVTQRNRRAIKLLTIVSFNVKNKRSFALASRKIFDEHAGTQRRAVEVLGVRPIEVAQAIVRAHPSLAQWVCTGDHSGYLQKTDSDIMVKVLETLAEQGVAGLPVHDSVIVPSQHKELARQVMKESYRRYTGFDIEVR